MKKIAAGFLFLILLIWGYNMIFGEKWEVTHIFKNMEEQRYIFLNAIAAIDRDHVVVGGYYDESEGILARSGGGRLRFVIRRAQIYYSENRGKNWTLVYNEKKGDVDNFIIHENKIYALKYNYDLKGKKEIATPDIIVSVDKGKTWKVWRKFKHGASHLHVNLDGTVYVYSHENDGIWLYSEKDSKNWVPLGLQDEGGKKLQDIATKKNHILELALSSNGRYVFLLENKLYYNNTKKTEELGEFEQIDHLQFSNDGKIYFTIDQNKEKKESFELVEIDPVSKEKKFLLTKEKKKYDEYFLTKFEMYGKTRVVELASVTKGSFWGLHHFLLIDQEGNGKWKKVSYDAAFPRSIYLQKDEAIWVLDSLGRVDVLDLKK